MITNTYFCKTMYKKGIFFKIQPWSTVNIQNYLNKSFFNEVKRS